MDPLRSVGVLGLFSALSCIAAAQTPRFESSPNGLERTGWVVSNVGDFDRDALDDVAVVFPAGQELSEWSNGVELFSAGRAVLRGSEHLQAWSGAVPVAELGAALVALPDLDADGRAELAIGAPGVGSADVARDARAPEVDRAPRRSLHLRDEPRTRQRPRRRRQRRVLDSLQSIQRAVPRRRSRPRQWNSAPRVDVRRHSLRASGRWFHGGCRGCAIRSSVERMQRIAMFAVFLALAACRAVGAPRADFVGVGNGIGVSGVVVVCPTSGRVHYEVWCPGHRWSVGCSFGPAVLALGDIDGDGLRDFAVADPSWTPLDGNEPPYGVWIVSGRSGAFLQSVVEITRATFGTLLAVTDDLDGDGVGDLLIGSRWMGPNVIAAHSTRTGERLYLVHTPDDPRAITLTGDRDGDGTRDFITWLDGPKLISGTTGAVISDATWPDPEDTSMAPLGDLDGDGLNELAVLNGPGCSVELRAQM